MKSRFLMYSAAIALFTALAIPLRLAAQNNQDHNNGNKHHHYVLIGGRSALPHISGKNGLGRFMVRRTTIRRRMRAKLRQAKQQLRERMHDPVPQTGQWLKSVV